MTKFKIVISPISLFYIILAAIIGLNVGIIDAFFGEILIGITTFRNLYANYLLPFLPVLGLIIIFTYKHYGKNSQKGMGLIFEAGNFNSENIPKRLVPLIIFSTWMSHLFGASVGREGVAVQIGATIGHYVGKFLSIKEAKKFF